MHSYVVITSSVQVWSPSRQTESVDLLGSKNFHTETVRTFAHRSSCYGADLWLGILLYPLIRATVREQEDANKHFVAPLLAS